MQAVVSPSLFQDYSGSLAKWQGWARLKKQRIHLHGDYKKYNLWLEHNDDVQYRSLLEEHNFQPFAAWIGLILDFIIIFIFNTASWWKRPLTVTKFFAAYAGVSPNISCT